MKFGADYYTAIANTDLQELFNYLATREIRTTRFDQFERTELHQEQVERSFTSVHIFWKHCLVEGHICVGPTGDGQYELDEVRQIKKTGIYSYYANCNLFGSHCPVKANNVFWKDTRKILPGLTYTKSNCLKTLPLQQMRDEFDKTMNGKYFE